MNTGAEYATTPSITVASHSTSTTTEINVSCGINASGIIGLIENDSVNINILNKSSLSGAFGIYNTSGDPDINHTYSNASGDINHGFWNHTVSFPEGIYWLGCNFTNATSGGLVTNVTVIEIDVDYNIITIGQDVFNISSDTGNLNISGSLHMDGKLFVGSTGSTIIGNVTITGGNTTIGSITDPTNITMFSNDGTMWGCGVSDAGLFNCTTTAD